MPTITLLPPTLRSGTVVSGDIAIADPQPFILRISQGQTDFEDPTLTLQLDLEYSTDNGVTWISSGHSVIIGGARGKDGLLPAHHLVGAGRIRGRLVLSKAARIGLDIETV